MADSSITFGMIQVNYGGYLPQADLRERFGYTSLIGLEFGLKLKQHLYFSSGAYFLFSDAIKENEHLAFLSSNTTWIDNQGESVVNSGWINRNGGFDYPSLSGIGLVIPFRIGYIIPALQIPKSSPNSGAFIESSFQYIIHKLSIKANETTPYLYGEYQKGYDRLTSGFGVGGSIGYRHFSRNRFVNFYLAFDYTYFFTKSHRFDFDKGSQDKNLRDDTIVGFRFGWCFPLYKQAPEKFYYF